MSEKMIQACAQCAQKPCRHSSKGTLQICSYGIAYYNTGHNILKKDPYITLRTLATNLRHEVNPVLQVIVQEASQIDRSVSTHQIFLNNPASKIVGASLIIDYMIQMITGVNDFHADPSSSSQRHRAVPLLAIIEKYFNIHAILKNTGRVEELTLNPKIDGRLMVSQNTDIVEYLVCILMDNAWKYSFEKGHIDVFVQPGTEPEFVNLVITNSGLPIAPSLNIFERGVKGKKSTKGFGFGLYWARILIEHYNNIRESATPEMEISHKQKKAKTLQNIALHTFTITNIPVASKK